MRILHLEDNSADAELVQEVIREEWPEAQITCVSTRIDFLEQLGKDGFDLILSDFSLPALTGLEALEIARAQSPDTPFIFLSGTIGEDRAIDALRSGAADYVLKDRMKRLAAAIARALRESEERRKRRLAETRIRDQAEMLNQAREAIFITDLADAVIYWNSGAERLFGSPAADAIGRKLRDLLDPFVATAMQTAKGETESRGQWQGEMRMHNRAGESVIFESRHSLIRDEAGRPKARLSINSDITDRKRLEEQLLRAQRMENVGLLAAGIAHDLNNMLAPILLAAPMVRDHVHDPGALKLLDTLEKSAERGANLVRQILAFSQGASSEQRLLQVKHLLRDISAVIAGTFPKSIQFEDSIPNDLWPVRGNATQIHQVLLNLCVNARDAMPDGGTLRLRAENRVLDSSEAAVISGAVAGAYIVLQIEDSGSGIPPEVVRKMWEPFYTTKESGKGTGLGLSTVRGIVENHNGHIDVTTAPGRGSTFSVFLPAADEAPADGTRAPLRATPQGRGELILIVDDELQIREMTLAILTRSGYRVILAADGAEAVVVFAQRAAEIRLVVTDLHMPNLDGVMLGRVLRQINPEMKVLVMSGMKSALGNRPDYRPDEFGDGFLAKPFTPQALVARVHELLRGAAGGSQTPFAGK